MRWIRPYIDVDSVKLHLYKQGFRPNYYKWVCHGEPFDDVPHLSNSANFHVTENPMRVMVLDACAATIWTIAGQGISDDEEEPIPNGKRFIQVVQAIRIIMAMTGEHS